MYVTGISKMDRMVPQRKQSWVVHQDCLGSTAGPGPMAIPVHCKDTTSKMKVIPGAKLCVYVKMTQLELRSSSHIRNVHGQDHKRGTCLAVPE